jgi:hypothetical protein
MGELLTAMGTASALRTLNGLFSTNYSDTKKSIKALRDIHKPFLKPPAMGEGKRRKRQRSLRFAASILTDDVKFKKQSPKDPTYTGRLSGWLKWLTWLERQVNNGANVAVEGHAVADISPHDQIVTWIDNALSDPDTEAMTFDWVKATSLSVNVVKTTSAKGNPIYSVHVKSLGGQDADVINTQIDYDDDFDPDPDISTLPDR